MTKRLGEIYERKQKQLERIKNGNNGSDKRPWNRENTLKPLPYRPSDTDRDKKLSRINEKIKEIMYGDTDEWLKKNGMYLSKMPERNREKLLGFMYDKLSKERDELEKSSDNVSYALKPRDDSKLSTDSFRGNGSYKKLRMSNYSPEVKKVSEKTNTSQINRYSNKEKDEDRIRDIESDMKDFMSSTDKDYLIETYAEKYGVDYDGGYVSDEYKEKVVNDIFSSIEYELDKARGTEKKVTFEAPSEKIQKMQQNASYKHDGDITVTINSYFDRCDEGVYGRYLDGVNNYNEVRTGLDRLDDEIAYVDFLYNEIEAVANRAHSSEEANKLLKQITDRYNYLEKMREQFVKKGNEFAKAYGTEFSDENKAKPVNNRSIESWDYNPNISDMGKHYENVNAGARLVMDGVLDEERAGNLTYSKAQDLDELNDVAETIFFSGFGGNAATEWFMTDEERRRYNTINYEQGGKAADEYYASIEQTLNDRKTEWMITAAEKLAEESRWQTTAGTILAAPLRAIISVYGNYQDRKNKNVSANSGDKQSQIFTDYARKKVAESLPEGWDTVYNIGTDFGDAVVTDLFAAMLCPGVPAVADMVSTLLGASSEMQQTVMEKLENGEGEEEALKAGLEAAKVDFVTGKLADSDKIFKVVNKYFPNVNINKLNKKELKYVIDYIMQEVLKEIIT